MAVGTFNPALRAALLASCVAGGFTASTAGFAATTATPIQHVIIIIGENHSFDNLFGTYKPAAGQKVFNLLSQQIVNEDGTPGPNFAKAAQAIGQDMGGYTATPVISGSYSPLPQPWGTGGIGLKAAPDTRFPANLPNGPFQITKYAPFAAYTGDPPHRFFQMWQEVDRGKHDLFAWVAQTVGTGGNGAPPPAGGYNPQLGAISLGFNNMNPYTDASGTAQPGDAPYFKQLADTYTLSDNYHQGVMGGTGQNFQMIVTGDVPFFTDANANPGKPYANQIENPGAYPGTNNYYANDGYSGGSYVNCSDRFQPGVASVLQQLANQHISNANCAANHYYLVNNYSLYYTWDGKPKTLGANNFIIGPQTNTTIGDLLSANNVSWKYYIADRGPADAATFGKSWDGINLLFHFYCDFCDPMNGYRSIVTNPARAKNLADLTTFLNDLGANALPAVTFIRPFEALSGHPGTSTADYYQSFLKDVIGRIQANSDLWKTTAIFVTTDEGGGYYDSGYIQAVDFFGDGTRIPLIAVSPYARQGYVDHTYGDHASLLKFIEANWKLHPLTARSRDNLPNPVQPKTGNLMYMPQNRPAIGDLMGMFDFAHPHF